MFTGKFFFISFYIVLIITITFDKARNISLFGTL